MPSLRHERVRELLKRTLGDILRRELNTEKCGLVSVNDVGVANDLHSATVFVSVLGSESQQYAASKQLDRDRSRFQYMLGQEVVLKYTPRIKFQINDAIAEGDRVLTLLDELEKNEEDPQ
jgi:ribosome-binding factor A